MNLLTVNLVINIDDQVPFLLIGPKRPNAIFFWKFGFSHKHHSWWVFSSSLLTDCRTDQNRINHLVIQISSSDLEGNNFLMLLKERKKSKSKFLSFIADRGRIASEAKKIKK